MHRFITKSIVIASVFSVALGAMAGCARKSNANNYAVVGITQEPGIFDPHTVVAAGDEEIIFNIYEGLYKFDYEGNLNPCLATDVEISDDASVYTFTIRSGVKFHDGSDLDANDVVYSLKRAAGLLDSQDGTALVGELDPISDVTVLEDGRVQVSLESGNSELISYFTTGIIPEGYDNCQLAPIGTGLSSSNHILPARVSFSSRTKSTGRRTSLTLIKSHSRSALTWMQVSQSFQTEALTSSLTFQRIVLTSSIPLNTILSLTAPTWFRSSRSTMQSNLSMM